MLTKRLYIKCSQRFLTRSPRGKFLLMTSARFYGSVGNGAHSMGENNDIVREVEILENQQEYNSTMLVCDEINKEVKNLCMEVASLKTTMEELRSELKEVSWAPTKPSGKLPEGLSVRKYAAKLWCCMCCIQGVALHYSLYSSCNCGQDFDRKKFLMPLHIFPDCTFHC